MADDNRRARVTVTVRGRVQGVGFRWWVQDQARDLGLAGVATNLPDGSVEVVAEGDEERCRMLVEALTGPAPRGRPGRVTAAAARWSAPRGDMSGFGTA